MPAATPATSAETVLDPREKTCAQLAERLRRSLRLRGHGIVVENANKRIESLERGNRQLAHAVRVKILLQEMGLTLGWRQTLATRVMSMLKKLGGNRLKAVRIKAGNTYWELTGLPQRAVRVQSCYRKFVDFFAIDVLELVGSSLMRFQREMSAFALQSAGGASYPERALYHAKLTDLENDLILQFTTLGAGGEVDQRSLDDSLQALLVWCLRMIKTPQEGRDDALASCWQGDDLVFDFGDLLAFGEQNSTQGGDRILQAA